MPVNVPALVVYLVATFLVCGIPFGKLVARASGVDIQHVGSGNIGTTNVAREVGKGAAAATLLLDAGKGALATSLASALFPLLITDGASVAPAQPLGWLVGLVMLAAVWGHIFSPFLGFHGGKGIAVGLGSLLGFMWPIALFECVAFAVPTLITRRVSVGSLTAAALLFVATGVIYGWGTGLVAVMVLIALSVVWAHRSNIDKLIHGRERPFSFHSGEDGAETAGKSRGPRR